MGLWSFPLCWLEFWKEPHSFIKHCFSLMAFRFRVSKLSEGLAVIIFFGSFFVGYVGHSGC